MQKSVNMYESMEPEFVPSIAQLSAMSIHSCTKFIFFLVIQLRLSISDVTAVENLIPGLQNRQNFYYTHQGDLNIAHLTTVYQTDSNGQCTLMLSGGIVRSEALKMAIESINNRTDILPNVTLGYLSIDDCWNGQKALEAAVYLVQQAIIAPTNEANYSIDDGSNGQLVIGVLGPSNSPMSVSVAPFFGVFRIPVMSLYATSDDLSDKTRYEYFLRLVPPDRFQEQTILEIARRLGWTYMAMLYTEGAYGENAASQISRFFRTGDYEICLSVSIRIPADANDYDYANAVQHLLENPSSRVVLTFIQGSQQEAFFNAVKKLAGLGTFLFLSGDTLQQNEGELFADVLEGSIYTDMPAYPIPGFIDRLSRLTPWTDPDDFWLSSLWESTFNCQLLLTNATNLPTCNFTSDGLLDKLQATWSWSLPVRTYDGVDVYARAVDQLIRDECPEAFANKSLLSRCIDGSKLLQYLKNSTTDGVMGRIEFNGNGDLIGDIVVRQYQRNPLNDQTYVYVEVGNWTSATNEIRMDMDKLSWKAFTSNDTTTTTQVLESVCSKPCRPDEYAIRQDVPCCWVCVKCRDNEIVKDNVTGCQSCPLFTWPDQQRQSLPSNTSRCIRIQPTHLGIDNPISVALLLLAVIGFLISVSVMVVYYVKRDHRLVKATSRELSLLILCGTLLASVSVVFFVAKPADGLCVCRSVGFHGSINLLYGPLLVKNIRTYRIFRAGQKSVKIPVGVGRNTQMVFAFAITCVQVGNLF